MSRASIAAHMAVAVWIGFWLPIAGVGLGDWQYWVLVIPTHFGIALSRHLAESNQ